MPLRAEVRGEAGAGRADRLAGHRGRTKSEPLTVLALEHISLGAGLPTRRRRVGRGGFDAEHRPELQLRRPTDHLDRLVGVRHPRQLDDDPPLPRPLQRGFSDAEGVDATSQHLEGAGRHVAIHGDAVGVLGLQDDLRSTLQVQSEPDRLGERQVTGARHRNQHGNGAPARRTRHAVPFS